MCSECTSGIPEVGGRRAHIFSEPLTLSQPERADYAPPHTLVLDPLDFQTIRHPCTFKAKCSDAVWRQ